MFFNKSISVLHSLQWLSIAWEEISWETIVKCFLWAGFHDQEEEDEECEEDTGAEVVCSLPLDIQKDVVSVNKIESASADLTVSKEVPITPDDLEHIFQEI